MRPRSLLTVLLIVITFLLSPGRAVAHAIIVESTPEVNGVVAGPLLEIKLRFNARLDWSRSKLTLISADGTSRVITLSLPTSPDSISAKVGNLLPGKYQLQWQVLAIDGHITRGEIPFRVVIP